MYAGQSQLRLGRYRDLPHTTSYGLYEVPTLYKLHLGISFPESKVSKKKLL
jgi:hypothetical protein